MSELLTALRAAAEFSRLRIIAILRNSELTVSEIVEVLDQSQPRVSRHLKLLCDSRLLTRYQEGSWVFHRLSDSDEMSKIVSGIANLIDVNEPEYFQDQERLRIIKERNADTAAKYFSANAEEWDRIRQIAVADTDIESNLIESLEIQTPELLIDLGTGTGRMLQILSPYITRGIGIDLSREMLLLARSNLDSANIQNCTVRQNDIAKLPFEPNSVDVVVIHQVLHYIDNPEKIVAESSRVLKFGGQLIIVDFLPHNLEFLREDHAHRRLGFSDSNIKDWAQHNSLNLIQSQHFSSTHHKNNSLSVGLWNLRK